MVRKWDEFYQPGVLDILFSRINLLLACAGKALAEYHSVDCKLYFLWMGASMACSDAGNIHAIYRAKVAKQVKYRDAGQSHSITGSAFHLSLVLLSQFAR